MELKNDFSIDGHSILFIGTSTFPSISSYLVGIVNFRVPYFLDFAFENQFINDAKRCPCPKCRYNKWETKDVVGDHLICKQFPKNYKVWI
ncbi:hypothetical protein CR513_46004, partial [Mucuna pruriens]